ncbi:hypothetical protein T09_10874 [Trichinella sp. T9]|nr:hypothetical protein T09_10874 [Trichinella sp. T9]
MLFGSLAEYDDVVQVYQAFRTHQASQTRMHELLKGGQRVAQSKEHHFELVQAKGGCDGCLVLIMFFHLNLPVAACQVQNRESLCPRQRIQGVISPSEQMSVLLGEVVQVPVVNTKPS